MSWAISVGRFAAPMRFHFRHASAERRETENLAVSITDDAGRRGFGEGCPRAYVTGEDTAGAMALAREHGATIAAECPTVEALRGWVESNAPLIDAHPAAFCAIEMALLDLLGQRAGTSVEALLGLPSLVGACRYTGVIGDGSPRAALLQGWAYAAFGMADLKVKLGTDMARDRARFAVLPRWARVRVDANNLYRAPGDCIRHMRELGRPIWAIEEPLAPGDFAGMRAVARDLGCRIILDESLARREQLDGLAGDAGTWIANIRVSKCGGILRAIALGREAQARGIGVILGAHVGETSLLTRAALAVGQGLQAPPLAREGAYGTFLLREDISAPSLRFGWGGWLHGARYGLDRAPGLGLNMECGDDLSGESDS